VGIGGIVLVGIPLFDAGHRPADAAHRRCHPASRHAAALRRCGGAPELPVPGKPGVGQSSGGMSRFGRRALAASDTFNGKEL
jgi:hypothetical protein